MVAPAVIVPIIVSGGLATVSVVAVGGGIGVVPHMLGNFVDESGQPPKKEGEEMDKSLQLMQRGIARIDTTLPYQVESKSHQVFVRTFRYQENKETKVCQFDRNKSYRRLGRHVFPRLSTPSTIRSLS